MKRFSLTNVRNVILCDSSQIGCLLPRPLRGGLQSSRLRSIYLKNVALDILLKVNSKGQLLGDEHITDQTHQFITIASDGQCLIWDTRYQVRIYLYSSLSVWEPVVETQLTRSPAFNMSLSRKIPSRQGDRFDFMVEKRKAIFSAHSSRPAM